MDASIAELLRKIRKPVIPVINKVDNTQRHFETGEFYKLGLGDLFPISSINGSGTGDLLDHLTSMISEHQEEQKEEIPHLAVVGRPNVGKSSLVNVLIGEERNIVTPISGTTRDSIHTRYKKFNHNFVIVDTAGLRKKVKVKENIEFYSVMRAVRAIEHSDICFLLIDATIGMESQDVNIFHLIVRNRKGVVVLVNKWDLLEKDQQTSKQFEAGIRKKLEPFNDVHILFVSALTKQRIHKALDHAIEVYENRKRKIPTSKLNEVMLKAIEAYRPPAVKGKYIRIKYVTQLPTHAPSFAFFCNLPQYVKEPYKRYLENQIRKNFNFTGVPIQIFMRKK
jgi:GTP-binding protein